MLKKFAKSLLSRQGLYRQNTVQAERWPNDNVGAVEDKTLLLFTPPNSGSTAIARFLSQSALVSSFRDQNCEGQWLVPGLSEADRWWPEKYVNYRSVASTWSRAAGQKKTDDGQIEFFVEKSPPNMVRYKEILKILPNHRAVVNNRNPYANIASQAKRYSDSHYRGVSRTDMIEHLCDMWIYRSEYLSTIIKEYSFPIVTYEDFCHNPMNIIHKFELNEEQYNEATTFKVKDYQESGVQNFNDEQIALLGEEEIAEISSRMSMRADLMAVFGYKLI